MLSIGGTYRRVTDWAPTAKLGGDRWILNFSGRSCAWKARYIDLDPHMAFFVLLDRGIYGRGVCTSHPSVSDTRAECVFDESEREGVL